jgi:glycosyltransferase involved in cell wall biosynthesis
MRILLVTRENPWQAVTGVASYVLDLAGAFVKKGHQVTHLYSESQAWCVSPCLRWMSRCGLPVAVLTVPPFLERFLDDRLEGKGFAPALMQLMEEALVKIRPDVLHIHDLSGVPETLIPLARARRCAVVVTFHDFWPFCRQIALIRRDLVPCAGSDGGSNCARYCADNTPVVRRFLGRAQTALPAQLSIQLRHAQGLYRRLRGRRSSQFIPVRPRGANPPEPRVSLVYAHRETRMREALLEADSLMTVSQFAKEMYIRHGYPSDRIQVLPFSIGNAGEKADRAQCVRIFRGYPVRFAYLGRVSPMKGAHLLAEAARGIPPEQARFTFYGVVAKEDRSFLLHIAGGQPNVQFYGRYSRDRLTELLDDVDVAVFPSICPETQGLVGLEAQAAGLPVIGAAHGAIPEYVHHEISGLLFSPGSAASLREQIQRIIRDPGLIAQLSARIRAPEPMKDHAAQVLRAYEHVTCGGAAGASP